MDNVILDTSEEDKIKRTFRFRPPTWKADVTLFGPTLPDVLSAGSLELLGAAGHSRARLISVSVKPLLNERDVEDPCYEVMFVCETGAGPMNLIFLCLDDDDILNQNFPSGFSVPATDLGDSECFEPI